MCRLSRLLLFLFCKSGINRIMWPASCCCYIFSLQCAYKCDLLAVSLVVLAFRLTFFFHCDTHTCAHARARTHTHTHTHTHTRTHILGPRAHTHTLGTRVSERAGVARIFSFVYLPVYVRVWLSALLSWQLFWNVRHTWRSFRVFGSQRHFPSYFSSFLSVLAWDPLSSLESTPVSI